MSDKPVTTNYNQLRQQIGEIIAAGRERARQAVEQEKTRVCWEVGQLLHEHLLEEKRADYGAQVVRRLAEDLELAPRRLYEMLELYRRFPIMRSSAKITFSHYVKLLSIGEEREREFYLDRVEEEGWSVRRLDEALKAEAYQQTEGRAEGEDAETRRILAAYRPKRGVLYAYQLLEEQGRLLVDLGFGIRYAAPGNVRGLPVGSTVVSGREEEGYLLKVDASRRTKLFTYRAEVVSVIDGDTVWAEIDCGFGVWTRQKLRLRGVDAPELDEAEGWRSRSYVRQALARSDFVLVTTSRADEYDRYLADLYYLPGAKDPQQVLAGGQSLNQELLARGLAQPAGD